MTILASLSGDAVILVTLLVYLGGILLLYRVAATVLQIPHRALLPELALTDQHRARMSAWLWSIPRVMRPTSAVTMYSPE